MKHAGSAVIAAALALVGAQAWATSPIVLNEYNAVDDGDGVALPEQPGGPKLLENDTPYPAPYDIGFEGHDSYFGRIYGNGGNWLELVVTQDRADMRGWSVEWSNADATQNQGAIVFSNDAFWTNLRAGTIITIVEDGSFTPYVPQEGGGYTTGTPVNLPTDLSFSPQHDDWWINLELSEANTTYVDTLLNFKIDNDGWQVRIKNAQGQVVLGPIGEGLNSVGGWGGSGINSQEAGALDADPSPTATGAGFRDVDYTSFGSPNTWFDDFLDGPFTQDSSSLQTWWTNRIPGDANCDGMVTISDLGDLASNWQATGVDWFSGDFNGDGAVTISDLGDLASNWQYGVSSVSMSFAEAMAAVGFGGANVPEPVASALVMATMLAWRRRRNT